MLRLPWLRLGGKKQKIAALEAENEALRADVDTLEARNQELVISKATLAARIEKLQCDLERIRVAENLHQASVQKLLHQEEVVEALIKKLILAAVILARRLKPVLRNEELKVPLTVMAETSKHSSIPMMPDTRKISAISLKWVFYQINMVYAVAQELRKLLAREIELSASILQSSRWFERNVRKQLRIEGELKAKSDKGSGDYIVSPYNKSTSERGYSVPIISYEDLYPHTFLEEAISRLKRQELTEEDIAEINREFIRLMTQLMQSCMNIARAFNEKDPHGILAVYSQLKSQREEIVRYVRALLIDIVESLRQQEEALNRLLDEQFEFVQRVEDQFEINIEDTRAVVAEVKKAKRT